MRTRLAVFGCCLTVFVATSVPGEAPATAPIIDQAPFTKPTHGATGQPVLFMAAGLTPPVSVFFSDGTDPSVQATDVLVDVMRGIVMVRVPTGAMTGNMKISAGGQDSAPYYFRVDPGTFVQGPDILEGQVTRLSDGSAVSGAFLILMRDTGCESQDLIDFAVTDGAGHYTMHGSSGTAQLFLLAPSSSGLANAGAQTTLGPAPTRQNFSLTGGTSVTGKVVDSTMSSAVPYARVTLDFLGSGAMTHEETVADATGIFSATLLAGPWLLRILPPPGDRHATSEASVTIGGPSQDLGNLPIASGVTISGILKAPDGSPLAGAEMVAKVAEHCCGERERKPVAGDGSYSLTVPGNQTYELVAEFDHDSALADLRIDNVVIGTGDVTMDLTAQAAAAFSGRVTDVAGAGIAGMDVQARREDGTFHASTGTCADGRYRLRVLPDPAGYLVVTAELRDADSEGPTYAAQAWQDSGTGTYFQCEGNLVPAPVAGAMTPGIDFRLPLAATIQGVISSQAAGCQDDLDSHVMVDDGSDHLCGMGINDLRYSGPGYRISHLPPSSEVPSLRACAYSVDFAPQCFDHRSPPDFDPISAGPGATVSGINFCLSRTCTSQTWYRDADRDGYGDQGHTQTGCTRPPDYVAIPGDCNDGNPNVHSGAIELCNGIDDNCDGVVDNGDRDRDGVSDCSDNCPAVPNPDQRDGDADGIADACDNCPSVADVSQSDRDHDGFGDACDNCPLVADPSLHDTDSDGTGDLCDVCPMVPDPDQMDQNEDGSGDACQPSLTLSDVGHDGAGALDLSLKARDPQHQPLSGTVQIISRFAREVTLQDLGYTFDCNLGFLPAGVPGEGLGFIYEAFGMPVLFDLDTFLLCDDGQQDYEIATGTCENTVTPFLYFLDLSALVPTPTSICVRRVGEATGFDATILDFEPESLRLFMATLEPEGVFDFSFPSGLPKEVTLPPLQVGATYELIVTVTDGNTVPVKAQTSFVYQGEPTMVIRNGLLPRAVIDAPALVECDQPGGGAVLLDGSGSMGPDPGDLIASCEWFTDFGQATQRFLGAGTYLPVVLPLGSSRVTLRVTESGHLLSGTAEAMITVADTTPPALTCPTVGAVECSAPGGSAVSLAGFAGDVCSPTVAVTNSRTGGGADASGFYPLGTTGVMFMATDGSGNQASCTSSVQVRDTLPPSLSLTLSPTTLWPPNHRMVPVQAAWRVGDVCDPAAGVVLAAVTSSEPDDAPENGDGDTKGDIQDVSPATSDEVTYLRAERAGDGPGRVYTLTYAAVDASANATSGLGLVTVPHDLGTGPEPIMMNLEGDGTFGMTHIYWNPVPGAEMYDLIQGDLEKVSPQNGISWLGPVRVLASGMTGTSYTEGALGRIPAAGNAFFYLLQYRVGQRVSGWGTESSPWPAEPTSCDVGCPGAATGTSDASSGRLRR